MNRYTIAFAVITYLFLAYQVAWTGEYSGPVPPRVTHAADEGDQKK